MAGITVQSEKNKISVRVRKNPAWEQSKYIVKFTDSSGRVYPMNCDTPDEVFSVAFEMADNNDIGRELSRKIRLVWNRL